MNDKSISRLILGVSIFVFAVVVILQSKVFNIFPFRRLPWHKSPLAIQRFDVAFIFHRGIAFKKDLSLIVRRLDELTVDAGIANGKKPNLGHRLVDRFKKLLLLFRVVIVVHIDDRNPNI